MAKGGFDNENPNFHWHPDHDDDYDDDEQEVNLTRPFQLDTTSTPYHPGEQIEMLKFPEEQSGLPGTFFAEANPWLEVFSRRRQTSNTLQSKRDYRKKISESQLRQTWTNRL